MNEWTMGSEVNFLIINIQIVMTFDQQPLIKDHWVGETDNKEDVIVSSQEFYDAIRTLKGNKAWGWIRYLLNI